MFHALHEAWRVLRPQGILIDLRPLCADALLEVVSTGGCQLVGPVDMSNDIADEIAANRAIEAVAGEAIFRKSTLDFFDFAYYWEGVAAFLADMDEYWKEDVTLPAGLIRRARAIFRKCQPPARLRLRVRMKLEKFVKQ